MLFGLFLENGVSKSVAVFSLLNCERIYVQAIPASQKVSSDFKGLEEMWRR